MAQVRLNTPAIASSDHPPSDCCRLQTKRTPAPTASLSASSLCTRPSNAQAVITTCPLAQLAYTRRLQPSIVSPQPPSGSWWAIRNSAARLIGSLSAASPAARSPEMANQVPYVKQMPQDPIHEPSARCRFNRNRRPLSICLLYTSDAADEEDSVDLGGSRIIKKKKK